MRLGDIYAGAQAPAQQGTSQPASTDRDTTQPPAPAANAGNHQAFAVSWIGIVIALVLLRVIYEVAE